MTMGKSSNLTSDDVSHVAKLAKLELTSEEAKMFLGQLSKVVSYIVELEEVDTKGVEPTSQTTGLENITRKDELQPERTLSQKDALSGSESVENGYFVVPIVLEERTI